jgi:trimethylamine--corrinoid protein Co-methyltransferase
MDADQAGMVRIAAEGIDMSENGQAMDALREVGPGKHFLGCEHTQRNFKSAFYQSALSDNNSFEQWTEDGGTDMATRANTKYKQMLADYVPPELDPAIDEALVEYMDKRKASFPDSNIS